MRPAVLAGGLAAASGSAEAGDGRPMGTMSMTRGGRVEGRPGGFTLVEVMIALSLFGLVVAGTLGVFILCQRMWRATALQMETARLAGLAVDRMVYGLGSNNGLRGAASVEVDDTRYKSLFSPVYFYWTSPTSTPPPANSAYHNLGTWLTNYGDGSWRVTYSNPLDGVKHLDYIKPQRTIVLWEVPNQPASRQLIGHYISAASVAASGATLTIDLTVWKQDGAFSVSNRLRSVVTRRN